MFDLSSVKSIQSNPLVAKEFVKHLTSFELLNLVKDSHKKGEYILNNESMIDGIIESEDSGKLLILASSSKLDDFAKSDRFVKIYNKGDVFKSALFGNSQYDWYSLHLWNYDILDVILEDVLKEDSLLKKPFYKNPRMNRKLIASIIKAKNFDSIFRYHQFDFTKISFLERYTACINSFEVEEIKSEDYYGKDSPDDNEMYFTEPHDALLVFVKDLFTSWDDENTNSSYYTTNLISYANDVEIGYHYDDWLSDEEKQKLESEHTDFSERYDKSFEVSFFNLIQFFDETTKNYMTHSNSEEGSPLFRSYSKVCMTITILPKLLSSYRLKKSVDLYLPTMLNSNNWVIRSSAYSFLMNNLDIVKDSYLFDKLINRFSDDLEAISWAVLSSSHGLLLSKLSDDFYHKFNEVFEKLNFDSEMKKFFEDIAEYIYGFKFRELDYEELERIYRNKFTYNSNNDLVKYLDFISSQSNGLSYQIGKTVGKLFK